LKQRLKKGLKKKSDPIIPQLFSLRQKFEKFDVLEMGSKAIYKHIPPDLFSISATISIYLMNKEGQYLNVQ
jgi:hypothetical protein